MHDYFSPNRVWSFWLMHPPGYLQRICFCPYCFLWWNPAGYYSCTL